MENVLRTGSKISRLSLTWRVGLLIMVLWIGIAQIMAMIAGGIRVYAFLAFLGSLCVVFGILLKVRIAPRSKGFAIGLWVVALALFCISFLAYSLTQSRNTYVSSKLMESYGHDGFNVEQSQAFLDSDRGLSEMSRKEGEIESEISDPISGTIRLWGFKMTRYLRLTFWPPLTYLRWITTDEYRYGTSRATKYFKQGKAADQYNNAISNYTKAIELDPKRIMAYYYRGTSYMMIGQYADAVSDFSKVIKLSPKDADAYYNRSFIYNILGQQSESISDLNKAIRLNPKYSESKAYYNRGKAYIRIRQHALALADLTKAINLNPQHADAYYDRSRLYEIDQHAEALSDITKAIELDPTNDKYYQWRGVIYQSLGQLTEALSDVTRAIELNSTNDSYYTQRGFIHEKLGQLTEALSDCNKAIEFCSTVIESYEAYKYKNRGGVYFGLGQYSEAFSDLAKAIELFPEDKEAYRIRGYICIELGQYTKAIGEYTKVIELDPNDAKAYGCRGIARAHIQKTKEAKEDMLQAIKIDPALKVEIEKTSENLKLDLQLDED